MRRSKNEAVKAAVGSYLKRRHYTDSESFRKSELQLSQSHEEMAVVAAVDKEVAQKNSILFSNSNNDTSQVDIQFAGLKRWILNLKEPYKSELAQLLCPIFSHLYIEVLRGGFRHPATKFFKHHQNMFLSKDETKELVEELSTVHTVQDIETNPLIKAFRSSKYRVTLSPRSMVALQRCVSGNGYICILQVLRTWFDIEEGKNPEDDVEEEEDDDEGNMNPDVQSKEENKEPIGVDDELKKLKEVIRAVREGPPPPSPLLVYSIMNSNENVTSGITTKDIDLLAAGFETSEIRLWSLTSDKFFIPEIRGDVSQVRLACDMEPQPTKQSNTVGNTVVMRGHSGPVYSIGFFPDTGLMVSCSEDTTVRAWRLDTFECATIYRGHNYPVWCLDINTLGVYMATGSHDRTAKLWNLERTFPLRVFAGHSQDVDCVKFHPNSMYLATGSVDRTVRLWSVSDGKLVRVFTSGRGGVYSLVFSPDGKYIASGGDDKRVRVWDLAAGSLLHELRGHSDTIVDLTWSPDGEILASCSLDSSVRLWEVKKGLCSAKDSENSVPQLLSTYSSICPSLLSIKYSPHNTLACVAAT